MQDNHYPTNLTWTPDENYVLIAGLSSNCKSTNTVEPVLINTGKGKYDNERRNWSGAEMEHDAFYKKDEFVVQRTDVLNLYWYSTGGKPVKQLTISIGRCLFWFDKDAKNHITEPAPIKGKPTPSKST